jgi:DNA-binding transcriptional MocR family regulator
LSADAIRDCRISPTAKVTLSAILLYVNEDGECWPSDRRLAEDICLSVGTARRALSDLVKAGYIARTPRRGRSSMTAVLPTPRADARTTPRADARTTPRADARQNQKPLTRTREPEEPSMTIDQPFERAADRWPRDVKARKDARKRWNVALAQCGNALEFEDRVNRWLAYWQSLPTDHDDLKYAMGMAKWLHEEQWRQEPPAPEPEAPLPYWYTHPTVDFQGNELDPDTGERIV